MALGQKIVVWDANDILRGMSTSDETSDGGFAPSTDQVNLRYTPGVAYQVAETTDKSTSATGDMIASTEDQSGSYSRLFVSADASQDGQFYSIDSTGTLTARGSEDTSHNYIQGRTDFISYQGEAYATTDTTIVRWSAIGGANTFNTSFFTFNDSLAPHPGLTYEDNAFFGDGNRLLRMTSAGGTPSAVLTLPTGFVITALGIDPGSGRVLIGIVNQYNVSGTINSQSRVSFYDGFSNKVLRTVLMDDMVTAFPTSEGRQYIAYGRNLGYWNGAGATFLRRIDVNYDNAQLLYKHRFTSIGPTLFFVQRRQIVAHGPLQTSGEHIFYPVFYNYASSNPLSCIAFIGAGSTNTGEFMSFAYSTSQFFTVNLNTVSTWGNMLLQSNMYDFNSEFTDGVWLRRVQVFYANQVTSNVDPGSLRLYSEEGEITTIGQGGLLDLRNTSGAATAFKEIPIGGGTGVRVRKLYFKISIDTTNPGVERIVFYGDPANQK